jgi:cytochrome c oxidase cbb3-type subunit 3
MSVKERDPHTGHMTTGHQWNGIKELNTKVPKPVWVFLGISVVIAVVMWLLLPTWPLGTTYTKGALGLDDRAQLKQELSAAAKNKSDLSARILASSYEQAKIDNVLMGYIRSAGKPLFNDNCSACHGVNGKGGHGYPSLVDKSWLWRDEDEPIEETIMETLRVGINGQHEDARTAQMGAFGKDGTIARESIRTVIDYVLSLNETPPVKMASTERLAAGRKLFSEHCSACHGDDAKGNPELGAPNLTDTSWIYGGSWQALFSTIWNGRQGHMPSWEARLSEFNRKVLSLYILDLNSLHRDKR